MDFDETLVGWDRVRSVIPQLRPSWVPSDLAEAWAGFGDMSEDEREVFLEDLVAYEGELEDQDQRHEIKLQHVTLYLLACSNDLAKVMSEHEGRMVPLGEAAALIGSALEDAFQRQRTYEKQNRVVPPTSLMVESPRDYHATWYDAGTSYSVISAVRNNFIHLASGERPRRFGRGWTKKRQRLG